MKKIIKNFMQGYMMISIALVFFLFTACEKENVDPGVVVNDDDGKNVNGTASIEEVGNFIFDASSLEKNDDGYTFVGSLIGENNLEDTFKIGEGNFEVIIGPGDEIEKITGTGIPEFPRVGIFAKMLKSFAWSAVTSHFEYELGAYYKEEYDTDLPLTDDRKYLHIKVLDETKGDRFELKNKVNGVIYSFVDFYLDILDPSVFFKAPLLVPKPSSGDKSILQKLAGKISEKGGNIPNVGIEGGIAYAWSNQGLINSQEYLFRNDKTFDLLGYEGFESFNTHSYHKAAGIAFPPLPLFQINAESYIGYPVESFTIPPEDIIEDREQAFLDWVSDPAANIDLSYRVSANGSFDMGGLGIGLILGILPNANGFIGNVFNEEINLDIVGGTLQYQLEPGNSFLKFGGEFTRPLLSEILHEDIRQYMPTQPTSEGYMFLSIGNDPEDWSLFVESSSTMNLPGLGEVDFSDSHFYINEDEIYAEGNFDLPSYGILEYNRRFTGRITRDGFEFESAYDQDITLPNGITLGSRDLKIMVTSDRGVYLEGSVTLPYGVTEAEVMAVFSSEKLSFEGKITKGLDLDLGFELPSGEFTFRTSTDPDEGFYLMGELDIPHLGYNYVEGVINSSEISLTGIVNREINIAGVTMPISNGTLIVSNSKGVFLDGSFTLPAGLATARMSGNLTPEDAAFSGNLTTGLTVAGHTFQYTNSSISASNAAGIRLSGRMNLYIFTTTVAGSISPGGQFVLTGSYQYAANVGIGTFSSNVGVTVKNTGASLGGTGTIKGPFGGTLYSGSYVINPNWSARTFRVCFGSSCFTI